VGGTSAFAGESCTVLRSLVVLMSGLGSRVEDQPIPVAIFTRYNRRTKMLSAELLCG